MSELKDLKTAEYPDFNHNSVNRAGDNPADA